MGAIVKPTIRLIKSWATAGLANDPAAKETTGWTNGEEPDPKWENFVKQSFGKWLEWAEAQLDENTPLAAQAVSKTVADTIVSVKTLGNFGIIASDALKNFGEAMIRDLRTQNGVTFNLIAEAESSLAAGDGKVRMYAGDSGIMITRNAYWATPASFEWDRDAVEDSQMVLIQGGLIRFYHHESASAAPWSHITGWNALETLDMGVDGLGIEARNVRVSKSLGRGAASVLQDELSISKMVRAYGTLRATTPGAWTLVNGLNVDASSIVVGSSDIQFNFTSDVSLTNVYPSATVTFHSASRKAYRSLVGKGSMGVSICDMSGAAIDPTLQAGEIDFHVFSEQDA